MANEIPPGKIEAHALELYTAHFLATVPQGRADEAQRMWAQRMWAQHSQPVRDTWQRLARQQLTQNVLQQRNVYHRQPPQC